MPETRTSHWVTTLLPEKTCISWDSHSQWDAWSEADVVTANSRWERESRSQWEVQPEADTAATSCRWEQMFWVRARQVVSSPQSKVGLSDEDCKELAQFLSSTGFPRWHKELALTPNVPLLLSELDLGGNKIGDSGTCALVSSLIEQKVYLRVLRLHMNHLSQGSAPALAELLAKSAGPVTELHLSHNWLGPGDVRQLITAAASRSEYPLKGTKAPLWLRVELQKAHNLWQGFVGSEAERRVLTTKMFQVAGDWVAELRTRLGYIPEGLCPGTMLCMPEKPYDGCKAATCRYHHDYGPIVHLPYFWRQGPGWTSSKSEHRTPADPLVAWAGGFGDCSGAAGKACWAERQSSRPATPRHVESANWTRHSDLASAGSAEQPSRIALLQDDRRGRGRGHIDSSASARPAGSPPVLDSQPSSASCVALLQDDRTLRRCAGHKLPDSGPSDVASRLTPVAASSSSLDRLRDDRRTRASGNARESSVEQFAGPSSSQPTAAAPEPLLVEVRTAGISAISKLCDDRRMRRPGATKFSASVIRDRSPASLSDQPRDASLARVPSGSSLCSASPSTTPGISYAEGRADEEGSNPWPRFQEVCQGSHPEEEEDAWELSEPATAFTLNAFAAPFVPPSDLPYIAAPLSSPTSNAAQPRPAFVARRKVWGLVPSSAGEAEEAAQSDAVSWFDPGSPSAAAPPRGSWEGPPGAMPCDGQPQCWLQNAAASPGSIGSSSPETQRHFYIGGSTTASENNSPTRFGRTLLLMDEQLEAVRLARAAKRLYMLWPLVTTTQWRRWSRLNGFDFRTRRRSSRTSISMHVIKMHLKMRHLKRWFYSRVMREGKEQTLMLPRRHRSRACAPTG